ncbi:MAG: DNA polymerase I [Dehalococcoidia bacterium]|nr:DNA polymerase I [Dehalococcoidia bacterium]
MPEKQKPLLLLFDGNALVHRAFHALPPLTVSKTGEIVNAVYGFAATLLKVLAEFKPAHWVVAFDRPAPTFRHEKFAEYKAQRPATPDELKGQIKRVHQLVETFHIPIFEIDGFEADDILGTLSKQATEQGIQTIIVSGDNDMLQAVSPEVKALVPRRAFTDTVLYDEEAVHQKYGIKPGQLTDFKALVGDASDNIPGVPGIGEKTAAKLIQQFDSIEGIYGHIEDITPGKLQTVLRQYQSRAFQNKELVTIVRDVPINLNLETCQVSRYNRDEVVGLFRELEFINLLPRLPQEIGETAGIKEAHSKGIYQIVNTDTGLSELISQLERAGEIAIDIESTLPLEEGEIKNESLWAGVVGMTVSPAFGKAFYIPMGHRGLNQPRQLPLAQVLAGLRPVLENMNTQKIAYDGKRIISILAGCGIEVKNLNFDPMIAAYLLGEKGLGLKALAFNRVGIEITPFTEFIGTGKKQSSIATLEVEQIADHACTDVDILWGLKESLQDELRRQGLWKLFSEVEMPLVPVLAAMERNGVLLDADLLRKISLELGREILKLEAEIYDSLGHEFNINSPQQLGKVLFEELRLPQARRTKTGYSTEASVMEALRGTHPIIELVLQYRQLTKLKSTYVDTLPRLVKHETGRIHTSFNQTGTTTGRLSSNEPNLQNIPVRGEMGRKIRQAIIAPPGSLLFSADYSQIDLRALAHLSHDAALIAAFASDEDIHAMTASRIFGVSRDEVTPEMRRNAKTVNFGVIYGMSGYGLEQATNFTREEASQFIALYFEKYPEVKEYIEATKEQARKLGYVQTVMGRRRLIPEINSPNRQIRQAAERMAVNAPVQGTSADIIKVAMLDLHREMKEHKLKSKMLLQIHDELIFEVPEEEIAEMKSLVTELMPRAIKLLVPIKIDIKTGNNWGEMAYINE